MKTLESVDALLSRNPFEGVHPPICKTKPRTGHQLAHRAGHQDFPWRRQVHDPRCYVNGDATDISSVPLDLAGMNACANLEAQLLNHVPDGPSTADRSSRAAEYREEPVPSGGDLATLKPVNFAAGASVVFGEKFAPGVIPEFDRSLSGTNDVGEEDDRE